MKRFSCPLIVHGCIAALLTVALYSRLVAQTTAPPRRNFSVRTEPQFGFKTWPADFNRDGRTDLIAGARAVVNHAPRLADLLVSLGRGDGTFTTPQRLGLAAQPLGTGDFNRDSRIDVVILGADSTLSVLPGNGNGTFGTPRRIASSIVATGPFASIADFDADGHRDVAVGTDEMPSGGCGVLLFPGNGDFTFDPPVELPVSHYAVMEGISGDFNKDGRRDLAVVTEWSSLFIFINRGRLVFEPRETHLSRYLADITAADVNRDSNLDLLIAASQRGESDGENNSRVLVLLGSGYGTFRDQVVYDTGVSGESTIVAGDFNRDGRIDVATGNASVHYDDELGYQLSDSISIMPGDGTGRLLRATTYALGRTDQQYAEHMLTHNSLNTSDLNGDRQKDLIASPGAILLNRAAAPSRTPMAFAGPGFLGF
jgi:hypothetical protein